MLSLLLLLPPLGCAPGAARAPATGAAAPADVLPVTEWERRFAWVEPPAASILLAKSRSADSVQLYESGYYWEGYVSMYEATGDTRYVDKLLEYVDGWIATALPCDQLPGPTDEPGFRGWASGGAEFPLYESYGWRFVTKLLYLMRGVPGYEARYRKVLEFTETNIWDKWYSRGANANLYRQNAHMASHWAYIGLYLAQLTESPTRREQCLTVANDISHRGLPNYPGSLRTQVIESPVEAGAAFWHPDWGETARPGSDVNHGEAVVTFALAAHEMGIPQWTRADMLRFVRLLDRVIWPTAGEGAGFVDGTGTGNGWLHGYAKLGRFDAALQRRLEAHPPGLDSIWHCGNMAANARILRGGVN